MNAVTTCTPVIADALPSDVLLADACRLSAEAEEKQDAIRQHRLTLAAATRRAGYDADYLLSADLTSLPDAICDTLTRVRVESVACRLRQLLRRIDRWHELLFDIRNLRQDAAEMKYWCNVLA